MQGCVVRIDESEVMAKLRIQEAHYGPLLLWDPTKKEQWALHVYSIANFVASSLEKTQNDFKLV